ATLQRSFDESTTHEWTQGDRACRGLCITGSRGDVDDRRDAPRIPCTVTARIEIDARDKLLREGGEESDDVKRLVDQIPINENQILSGCAPSHVESPAAVTQ